MSGPAGDRAHDDGPGGGVFGPDDADVAAAEAIVAELRRDGVVRAGPFAGMRFRGEASWGPFGPYLLGTYEAELHDSLERLVAKRPPKVIDIGCAEGYYAIGLARRLPDARVVAFDIDPDARRSCQATAADNGVADQVDVRGECDAATLDGLLGLGDLVIVDCEGAELDILRPDIAPRLADVDLVVELHDFVDPAISEQIVRRFTPTHDIELVEARPRDIDAHPELAGQPGWVRFLCLYEGRPTEPHPMRWAVMERRASAG